MQAVTSHHWSILISILLEKYFSDLISTCILWPKNFGFNLEAALVNQTVLLQINTLNLETSFEDNIYNFSKRESTDGQNNVYYDYLVKKLVAAIEQTHCEGFLVFQDDIPKFVEAFQRASSYSIWRSMNNRFLFAYSNEHPKKNYFQGTLFKNQYNILIVEANSKNSSIFHLKTNKFVGSYTQNPAELIVLSTFYALNRTFVPDIDLFSKEKLYNLQGREIIVGVFDYRPFVAVDFQRLPLFYDQAQDNPTHLVHADGAEIRIAHVFCELYNCTLQFDTTEKEDWGLAFSNYSGYGIIGMVIEGKIHMAFQAMYQLHSVYIVMDMTAYLGRSGVTCLVPAASSLASWDLPLRPFEYTLWLAVLACLCLETLVLLIARKFEYSLQDRPTTWLTCLKFGFTTTLKLFVSQNSSYLVLSYTVRTFLFSCYVFDMILSSVYGGGLSAVLTLPTFGESADSVEKLVKFNLKWTGSSNAWTESISDTEGDGALESIYKRLVNNFEVNTRDELRTKAQTSNMGFVIERMAFGHLSGGEYITPQALQRLKLMVDDIYSQFTIGMVPRLWPHLEKFNDLLLRWHSSGLDKFWEWKSTADYLNIHEQNQIEASKYNAFDEGPAKLNTQNFAGLIMLWIAGMLLSTMAFMAEIIWYKLMQKNK